MPAHPPEKQNVKKKCGKCGVWPFLADWNGNTKAGQFAQILILAMGVRGVAASRRSFDVNIGNAA
jgi:hypothetical protein